MYNYGYDYTATADSLSNTGMMAAFMGFFTTYFIFILIICVISVIATWKIFVKAGKPGWAAIIPFYNTYVLFELVGMKGRYVFLAFIPFVGSIILAVMNIIANVKLAKCFGKSDGFAVGLVLLNIIFLPILAFDDSTYEAPASN